MQNIRCEKKIRDKSDELIKETDETAIQKDRKYCLKTALMKRRIKTLLIKKDS